MKRIGIFTLVFLGVAAAILALSLVRRTPTDRFTNKDLQEALKGTTRIVVREGGTCHRGSAPEKKLAEVTNPTEIVNLLAAIQIEPGGGFACMCCGDPTFEFYKGRRLNVMLGYHHSQSVRWPRFEWDAMLTEGSQEKVLSWLDAHGVTGPRKEKEEAVERRKKEKDQQAKWLEAAPAALKESWNVRAHAPSLHEKLKAEVQDEKERIRQLLHWYGSGAGTWREFPGYETIALDMIVKYSTESIVAACEGQELSTTQVEGLSRYLAGYMFRHFGERGLERVPEKLKQRLLEHCLESTDEDKKRRAAEAFGSPDGLVRDLQ